MPRVYLIFLIGKKVAIVNRYLGIVENGFQYVLKVVVKCFAAKEACLLFSLFALVLRLLYDVFFYRYLIFTMYIVDSTKILNEKYLKFKFVLFCYIYTLNIIIIRIVLIVSC